MEYINEVWRTDLYKLQQQAPKAKPVPKRNDVTNKPPYYGIEYHGCISREEVEEIMENQGSGAYIIRDGVRTSGTYTLVIKFDDSLKNYKLFYDLSIGQHFVGFKYFEKINDLVQDGLIHLYIESRGAAELKKIAECNIYEDSPFFKARYYTLQMTRQRLGYTSKDQGQPNIRCNADNQRWKNLTDSQSNILQSKVNESENVPIYNVENSIKNINPFYSKDETKFTTNPFLNSGELLEQVETTICPPIRHSSLISSQLARQKQQQYGYSGKTFSDDESIQGTSQDSSETFFFNIDRQADTSSSSSIDTRTETKNSLGESGYTISTTDTNSLSSDASLDNQIPLDSKSEISIPSTKCVVSQYNNCFADQEKSHNFKTHTFKGPHWCDFCTHFMWGLVAQGVKCQDCGFQAHRKCSDRVPSDCLPVMKRLKRVFGVELTSLGKVENRGVPLVLLRLISLIEDRGLENEGIYRVSGNAELIEEVKADLDKDIDSVDLATDIRLTELHNISSLIKLFFRQLPIPLVTLEVSSMLTDLFKSQDNQKVRLEQMKDCLLRLPLVHYSTLKYFMAHLRRLSIMCDINKMTVENLAIIFAPSLISHQPIPVPGSSYFSPLEMQEIIHRTIQSSVDIVEDLIRFNDLLFVDERQI